MILLQTSKESPISFRLRTLNFKRKRNVQIRLSVGFHFTVQAPPNRYNRRKAFILILCFCQQVSIDSFVVSKLNLTEILHIFEYNLFVFHLHIYNIFFLISYKINSRHGRLYWWFLGSFPISAMIKATDNSKTIQSFHAQSAQCNVCTYIRGTKMRWIDIKYLNRHCNVLRVWRTRLKVSRQGKNLWHLVGFCLKKISKNFYRDAKVRI